MNFNKIGCNSVTKTTIWLPFLLRSNTVHEIREKLFPRVKSKIQIRNFFSRETWKIQIRDIKLPRKIFRHTVNCERVCFSNIRAIRVCLNSDFNNHAFGNCVRFSSSFPFLLAEPCVRFYGQENRPPPATKPPLPSPRVPERLWSCNLQKIQTFSG